MMARAAKTEESQKPHILLIDGYGFVFRAYHSLPPLTRKDGTPVGAVLGFTNMLMKMLAGHKADYMAVIFDAGRKTFRNEIYAEYKANRPPAPEDLIPQFALVREAATALNVRIIEQEGYEADDIIATYAKIAREKNCKLTIVSSDKDLMQLVGEDDVQMYDPMKNKVIGVKEVQEKFGVAPEKVLDVLSLMGDSSDNVPGVPGIGPKTAAELVTMFGSLDEVINHASEIKQNKRRETIIENSEKALLSRKLISLCNNVPLEAGEDLSYLEVVDIDYNQLQEFLVHQEFKSLLARISDKVKIEAANIQNHDDSTEHAVKKNENNSLKKGQINLIHNIKDLRQLIGKYGEIENIALCVHIKDDLEGIAFSINNADYAYVPVIAPLVEQGSLFSNETSANSASKGITKADALQVFAPLFADPTIMKLGHDLKETYKFLQQNNIKLSPFDDVMLMSYVLGAGAHAHGLKELANIHLEEDALEFGEKEFAKSDENARSKYMEDRLFAINKLHALLKPRLFQQHCLTLYETFEKPMLVALADMELTGICLDVTKLKELSKEFTDKIATLEKEVYSIAACEFNIGSPKQLGEVLFERLGIKGGKKSKKTGAYSTDVKVLSELAAGGYEIAEKILNWRHFSKLKSTYTDSLQNQMGQDGRVHTHFLMAATNTGRLSSQDPNLQNIPIRSEEGGRIREAFVAAKGHKLISADYSQIELRLLASIADIGSLKEAFKNNMDIHAVTASQMFGMPVEEVNADLRRRAKTINFGIIYGISAFGLSQRLGISRVEAGDYIKKYFTQYPGIEEYMSNMVEFARTHGYVETIFGRKCYINGINDKNAAIRQFSERAAINAPLQGSAADIIKKAMIDVYYALKHSNSEAKLLLQVHDELVLEAPEAVVDEVARIVKKSMEHAANMNVPLTVDVNIGTNWRKV